MPEWINNLWGGVVDATKSIANSDLLQNKNLGTTLAGLGALGQAYGAYKSVGATEDYNNNLLAMQKTQQQYDIAQLDEEKKRRDKSQDYLNNSIASIWGTTDEDEQI